MKVHCSLHSVSVLPTSNYVTYLVTFSQTSMRSHILRTIATGVALTLLLFSCRQPQDLDTDRTVVPTNLPEIIDFSPKAGAGRITITGKNFVNVQMVKLDTLTLDSVVVESSTLLHAYIPFGYRYLSNRTYIPITMPWGVLNLSVITKRGTTQATEGFVYAYGTASGKIILNKQPLDSTLLYVSSPTDNFTNIMAANTAGFPIGWYLLYYGNDPGYYITKEAIVRPYKSGYSFSPMERRIVRGLNIVGGQDFEASPIPPERLPSVTSITPSVGASYGWSETGTTIVLSGTGFNKVKKAVIVTPYPSPEMANPYSTTLGYKEAKAITIESDNKLSIAIPRLDGTKAIPGRTYNCQIYLLTDEGSIVAPQRISITYL